MINGPSESGYSNGCANSVYCCLVVAVDISVWRMKVTEINDDYEKIWLQPACNGECGRGREWCQDNVWGYCEECGMPPTLYLRAPEDQQPKRKEKNYGFNG